MQGENLHFVYHFLQRLDLHTRNIVPDLPDCQLSVPGKFVLEHINYIQTHWYRYLVLNNTLTFFLLFTLHLTFGSENGSIEKVLVIALLLVAIYMFYFILYRVVLDVIKTNQLEKE